MFRNESADRLRIEEADSGYSLGSKLLLEQRTKRTAQPLGGGKCKAVFASPDDGRWQQAFHGPFQDVLHGEPPQFQRTRHSSREFDNLVIEKWRAYFKTR